MTKTTKALWLLLALLVAACFPSRERAQGEARQYAKDLGYEVLGVSCSDIDTDSDGYVSCTLRAKGDDGAESVLNIECAADGPISQFNTGCKVALPKLKTNTTVHNHN